MEYEFYCDFMEEAEDIDIKDKDVVTDWDDDLDTDTWAIYELRVDNRPHRIRITEYSTDKDARADYRVEISEKFPLQVQDEGWTRFREISESKFEGYSDTGFRRMLLYKLDENLPADFQYSDQKVL